MARPVIGISCEMRPPDPRRSFSRKRAILTLNTDYAEAVVRCGGSPLIVPLVDSGETLVEILSSVQGIILSGGDDVAALHGEWQVRPECQLRSEHEHRLIELARRLEIPIFGICRGLQQINVSFGGTLWEDLPAWKPGAVDHRRGKRSRKFRHEIHVQSESFLTSLWKDSDMDVNSSHHQAARGVAVGLTAVAFAEDGVIEALESSSGEPVWAVQWHPERLGDHRAGDNLISWFISVCQKRSSSVKAI